MCSCMHGLSTDFKLIGGMIYELIEQLINFNLLIVCGIVVVIILVLVVLVAMNRRKRSLTASPVVTASPQLKTSYASTSTGVGGGGGGSRYKVSSSSSSPGTQYKEVQENKIQVILILNCSYVARRYVCLSVGASIAP